MLLLQTPKKFGAVSTLRKDTYKCFYYLDKHYPRVGRDAREQNRNAAQQKGCAMEYFIYCLLEAFNPDSKIEFDLEKCALQWHFGRDGKADDGYDIILDGRTIDVKADSAVRRGYVCLELKTKTGLPSLLLGNTDYSIHAIFTEKNLPNLIQLNKGAHIVFVDLQGVRQMLKPTDKGYTVGPYTSRRTDFGTEVIDLPIAYLQKHKLADTYKL